MVENKRISMLKTGSLTRLAGFVGGMFLEKVISVA
jgi:hypothetical protein